MALNSKRVTGKIFYTIGEVAEMTNLKSHVLRYWESEFATLKPQKRSNGRRAYRETDIQLIKTIRRLLYEEGYTISGARKKLAEARRKGDRRDVVSLVKEGLEDILAVLK